MEELFWGATRFFEMLAADRPIIVLINDLHWAEKTFLDLIVSVLETARAPIVLVGSARHDLLEEHPDWGARATARPEPALAAADRATRASRSSPTCWERTAIDPSIRERIVASAQGNPLFVEQMLSMLIDDGLVAQDGRPLEGDRRPDGRRHPAEHLRAPVGTPRSAGDRRTLGAGTRLRRRPRLLADRRMALADSGEAVAPPLSGLRRKQLIEPTTSWFPDDLAYQFLHILIRDEAYGGILKRRRAELHERFADWLLGSAEIRVDEQREIIGYHFEQSVAYRTGARPAR